MRGRVPVVPATREMRGKSSSGLSLQQDCHSPSMASSCLKAVCSGVTADLSTRVSFGKTVSTLA
jgi:hypothetical protein